MTTRRNISQSGVGAGLRSSVLLPRTRMAWLGLAMLFVVTAFVGTAQAQQPTRYPATVVDFNQDGIPDVLITSTTSPTATIALGTVPYGTFSTNAKAVTLPAACTGASAGALLAGDFNRDGLPDLAFFCGDVGGPSGVLLGHGDGTFGTAKTFAGAFASAAVLGDFNHDGKLDIVVVGPTGSQTGAPGIQFFAGNGDGTFAVAVVSKFTAGSNYSSPVAVDVDGDGYPDIVLGSFAGSGTLDVFANNHDGTFGVASQGTVTPNVSVAVGAQGSIDQSIFTGNFFGTGKPDFAVPDTGATPGVFIVKNTSTSGAFSLAAAAKTDVASLTSAMAGGFTGSGFTDLAVANGTTISVLADDGAGNFTANYSALTLATTSSTFSVADANGDGYADIYTIASPNAALVVSVNLVTGSASATSQPVTLNAGTQPISAVWPGNINFSGSTASGTQDVIGTPTTTMVTSSVNPSNIGQSVTFTAVVAPMTTTTAVPTGMVVFTDGTATLGSANLNASGVATLTTIALTAGTHQIQATYAGDSFFAGSVSMVLSQVVNNGPVAPILTWATPAPISFGTPLSATQLDAMATNANGAAIPGAYVYTPPVGTVLSAGAQTLSVTFTPTDLTAYTTASKSVTLTVNPLPVTVTLTGPPTASPGTQPSVELSITNPYPIAVTATLTLTFVGSATPPVDDPAVQFADGGRTLTLVVPANSTISPTILLQAGTDAGAITVTPQLIAGGVDITPSTLLPVVINEPAAVPVASSASLTRTGNTLTVTIQGFSNTREMTQAVFHFTAAPGSPIITTPDITVPVGTLFGGWYSSTDSIQYGSTFTYTQVFDISDAATNIGSVEVTLTNTIGASISQTVQ